jgi:uncharacterized protein
MRFVSGPKTFLCDMKEKTIAVEIAYAKPDQQKLIRLNVIPGTNAIDAVQQSGVVALFPEIDLSNSKLGVFGKVLPKPQEYELREGDRVEIYRPLIIDPKQARINRAGRKKNQT